MSALGSMVAGVAHEINNPLGFVAGNLAAAQDYCQDLLELIELYQKKVPDCDLEIADELAAIEFDYLPQDLPKLLNSMQGGVVRIREISNSLRTFSRADQDYFVSFNVKDGLDSTLLILKHRLKGDDTRPEVEVITAYGEVPPIECFPGQLNQVFMNLLANAVDACEESNGGYSFAEVKERPNKIEVRTSLIEQGQMLETKIKDNGTGMDDKVRKRAFDSRFTTKEVGKGTGLGLAIAHQIITEKHNGTLQIHSQLGKGSEFVITLPVKQTA